MKNLPFEAVELSEKKPNSERLRGFFWELEQAEQWAETARRKHKCKIKIIDRTSTAGRYAAEVTT